MNSSFRRKAVVVPVDFSDESLAAVDVALQIVDEPSHLHVLHVMPIYTAGEPGFLWNVLDEATRREHARQTLRERLPDDKYQGVKVEIAFGDPGESIAQFAESIEADLVVLPSHGRTGLSRLLIGSVAERVARLSPCAVLVLKT